MGAPSEAPSRERLRLARQFQGLSQTELGDRVSLTHAAISQFESGVRVPSRQHLSALAEALGVEPHFFSLPPPDEFRPEECRFRRRKTTLVGVTTRVLAIGSLFGDVVRHLERTVAMPVYSLAPIRAKSIEEIERAAERTRMALGLSIDLPIRNVTRAIERAGAVVARLAAGAPKVDAFSRAGSRGVVVLNSDKGFGSRSRFDIAHETGHLVLHPGEHESDEHESEADRFGGALLLPRVGIVREFPRFDARVQLEALLPLKARWKVSVMALIFRAHELRLLSHVQYQQAMKRYYSLGWHKGEPGEFEPETPETVSLAFDVLRDHAGQSFSDIARTLALTPETLAFVLPDVTRELPVDDVPLPGKVIPLRRRA
jgi:Zn-dependent peptidase ImmA (M78 family)/DNA-binding XRE family transcriptional regulator